MSSSSRAQDLTSGALLPQVLKFSLPMAATGVLQLLFNAADTIVVGKFAGSNALAAVGATGSLISLLVGAFLGVSVGVNILIARYLGSKDTEHVSRAVHSAAALSIILGVLVFLVGFLFSRPMLRQMSTPEEILPLSDLYLRIYFIGVPANLMYNFGAAVLRAFGDTRRPMMFLFVSGIINVILNLVTVIFFHMGVAGVAIATSVSQYVSLILVVRCLVRLEGCARLELKKIRLYPDEALRMIQIGLPAGLQSVIFSISNVMIQSSVNSFGAAAIAGHTASANISGFTYQAMNSVYHAAMTFTSQALGAGKLARTKKVYSACAFTVLLIGIPMCAADVIFGPQLLTIYINTADPAYAEIIRCGMIRTWYLSLPYFTCGFMEVACGMVRGLGKAWLPMIVATIGSCALRLVWIWTIFARFRTLESLYISYPISWILTAGAHIVCFLIAYRQLDQRMKARAAGNPLP